MKKIYVAIAALLATSASTHASAIFVGCAAGNGGPICDSATFTVSGSTLIIALKNTSPNPTGFIADEFLGLFWNSTVAEVTFTPVNAFAQAVINSNNISSPPNVSVECAWAYVQGPFLGTAYGVGGAEMGHFGLQNLFGAGCGNNGQPDGGDYGIVPSSGVMATDGIPSIAAFVRGTLTLSFTIGGQNAPQFNESNIQNVLGAFGTSPDFPVQNTRQEQNIPEPFSKYLASAGLLGISMLRLKFK